MSTDTHIDALPPVVQLLLREPFREEDLRDPRKYLKRLLPELRRQAEWSVDNYKLVYPPVSLPAESGGLRINPSLGLDPFSSSGKCSELACRLKNADEIARTIGLYADVALIGDHFTQHLFVHKRWSDDDYNHFIGNLLVLLRLKPLVEAGIFRFASNFSPYCATHAKELSDKAKAIADELLEETTKNVSFQVEGGNLVVRTTDLHGIPLRFVERLSARHKRQLERSANLAKIGRSIYAPVVHQDVLETLLTMKRSAPINAVTFSNSRISVLTARGFDEGRPPYGDIEVWEASRSASLPWVSALSATQVVKLREEATKALPRFRERMSRALTGSNPTEALKIVRDLREEASEVKAELDALDLKGESRFRAASGLLGMTISVYGFAGEFLAPGLALGGLASLLGLLHAADHKERYDVAKTISRPGYVLVKAREIVEHAQDKSVSV